VAKIQVTPDTAPELLKLLKTLAKKGSVEVVAVGLSGSGRGELSCKIQEDHRAEQFIEWKIYGSVRVPTISDHSRGVHS
jgi:hypothetical protein